MWVPSSQRARFLRPRHRYWVGQDLRTGQGASRRSRKRGGAPPVTVETHGILAMTAAKTAEMAMMTTVFLTVYGKEGMKDLAVQNLAKAKYAADTLGKGAKVLFNGAPRFHEFVLDLGKDAENVNTKLLEKK